MEEAYAAARSAVLRLVSSKGEEAKYRDSGEVLRSVLQRRPVALGFVVSLIARNLQDAATSSPHAGVRVALETVLPFYDPRASQSFASIILALGEDRLQAHLTTARGEDLVLPWPARLSLLHACLAAGRTGGCMWAWLPNAADSACSAALQALSMESCKWGKTELGMGKGSARKSPGSVALSTERGNTGGTDRTGIFSAAMLSQVCADLAAAGGGAGQTEGTFFRGGGPETQLYPARSVGLVPEGCFLEERGGDWLHAFRFKLEALRDELLVGTESDASSTERQYQQSLTHKVPGQGELTAIARCAEVRCDSVTQALRRIGCSEASVLAVEAALETEELWSNTPENRKRKCSATETVKLNRAIETCLFDVGLPLQEGEGRLIGSSDASVVEDGYQVRVLKTAAEVGRKAPSLADTDAQTRRACTVLQGFVSEGVRIRDILFALMVVAEREESPRKLPPMGGSRSQTGADIVASVQSTCNVRRVEVNGILLAFVEWMADNAWVWQAEQGADEEGWEGDLAAAATAIVVVSRALPVSERDASTSSIDSLLEGVRAANGGSQGRILLRRIADSTELLDRLLAGAAAAIMTLESHGELTWADVLRRVTLRAGLVSVNAYAAACVERSVALSGYAPFAVAERQRLGQAEGGALWRLLEQACVSHRGATASGQLAAGVSVLIRAVAAAVISCRRLSCPWMIAPGLLGASPVRLVADILLSADCSVRASDVLDGLLARPGRDGPALAADFFAVVVSAVAEQCATGTSESDGNAESRLRSQAISWLTNALSASCSISISSGKAVSVNLARLFTQRAPYETKPVLLAVKEAIEPVAIKHMTGNRSSTTRESVSERGARSVGWQAVASLAEVCNSAISSSLLPLPTPLSSPALLVERCARGGESDAGGPRARSRRRQSVPPEGGLQQCYPSAMAVTAGLLLDAFLQRPEATTRAIRRAVQAGDCDQELFSVQSALRAALCSPPAADEQPRSSSGGEGIMNSQLAMVGSQRARACLLFGHLVESGATGWEEAKASMVPPPRQLMGVTTEENVASKEGTYGQCRGSRQRITALRLELWLRSLCHSSPRHVGLDPYQTAFQIPDVFRLSRTLAKAISRDASSHVTSPVLYGELPNGSHRFQCEGVSSSARGNSFTIANGTKGFCQDAGCLETNSSASSLKQPRRALIGRLRGVPGADALLAWVSGMVQTVRQFKEWLPWQAFADELRESLQQNLRKGNGTQADPVAATAAAFALCEVLLAWEGVEEIAATVFGSKLSSTTLNTAMAPVTSEACPPLWLDILRYLVDATVHEPAGEARTPQGTDIRENYETFAVAAAAAVWIGGSESGSRAADGTHEAWVSWYGAKLGPLISASRAGCGSGKFLVLGSTRDGGVGEVEVRPGAGWEGHTIEVQRWEDWGRSSLQAAWNFPSRVGETCSRPGTNPSPPPIVLPPFAAWLRVVLRSGNDCREGRLEGYLRRMAREVYLPCEFQMASGEMARQWLAALIEAEVAAEGKAGIKQAVSPTDVSKESSSLEGSAVRHATCRRRAVKAFFREELLRFGGGDAPVAPVGGPLTWLWPLEAVVTACGRAGPLGGSMRARHRSLHKGSKDLGAAGTGVELDGPPSALARALCAVPHDLVCGSRRFGGSGGRPPPATLRAFATRAVDLLARALATAPCRHWSVARQLIIGLGLLYHALAKPESSCGNRESRETHGSMRGAACAMNVRIPHAFSEAAAAQAAALATIESLMRIALGLDGENGEQCNGSSSESVEGRHCVTTFNKTRTPVLPSSCRALLPLEAADCGGTQELAEALMCAGAWRTAGVFVRRREFPRCSPCERPSPVEHTTENRRSSTAITKPVVCSQSNGMAATLATPLNVAKKARRNTEAETADSLQGVPSTSIVNGSRPDKTLPCMGSALRSNGGVVAEETAAYSSRRVLSPTTASRSERGKRPENA